MEKRHDVVRQVLMNELGFTREGVRAEMRKIIEEVVAKGIKQLLSQENSIQNMATHAVLKYIDENDWEKETIKLRMRSLAQAKATELFDLHYGK